MTVTAQGCTATASKTVDLREVDHSGYYLKVTGAMDTPHENVMDFYNNNTIYHNTCDNGFLELELFNDIQYVCEDSITWRIDGIETCQRTINCGPFNLSSSDQIIEVLFGEKKTVLLRVNVSTYTKRPVVKFERGGSYDGEYGYDDASRSNFQSLGDYDAGKIRVNGSDYYSHYLTLLLGQNVTIKIIKDNMDNGKMSKDPNFYVKFTPSDSVFSVNSYPQIQLNHTELSAMNGVYISSYDSTSSHHFSEIKNIKVTDQCDDNARGQLMVVSGQQKSGDKIIEKLIFIDNGQGNAFKYSSSDILNHLNKKSHNQFFRKWYIDVVDTIDISAYWDANKNDLQKEDKYQVALNTLYYLITGNSAPSKSCYVMNFDVFKIDGSKLAGKTFPGMVINIFHPAIDDTFAHEFGHYIGLLHTWDTGVSSRNISQETTDNYMDYSSSDDRNMFWWYQILLAAPN